MKLFLTAILLCCIYCFAAAQQLPNSSFESWSLRGDYIEPDGWISTNAFAANGTVETCYPFEDARTGKWAMKLESRIDPLTNDTLQAILVLGSDYDNAGIPYNQRPTGLKLYYQHNLKDTALAAFFLTKWNTQTNRRDTIASAVHFFTDNASSYKELTLSLTYTQSIRPDTCIAVFLSSLKAKPNPGNFLLIDDLELTGNVNVSSSELLNTSQVRIYPNPVSEKLYIETKEPIKSVSIINMKGKEVLKLKHQEIDISILKTGVYYLFFQSENGMSFTKKFIKN